MVSQSSVAAWGGGQGGEGSWGEGRSGGGRGVTQDAPGLSKSHRDHSERDCVHSGPRPKDPQERGEPRVFLKSPEWKNRLRVYEATGHKATQSLRTVQPPSAPGQGVRTGNHAHPHCRFRPTRV